MTVRPILQDFEDIMSQPTLEGPAGRELEGKEDKSQEEESHETGSLCPADMNTVVQVHQQLCLGYGKSLWYQSTAPANRSKEHIKALVSSFQIASPVISHFYHLIGQWLRLFAVTFETHFWILTNVFPPQIQSWIHSWLAANCCSPRCCRTPCRVQEAQTVWPSPQKDRTTSTKSPT